MHRAVTAVISLLSCVMSLLAADAVAAAETLSPGEYPSYDALSGGPWQVRLLPGHDEFTFTMQGSGIAHDDLLEYDTATYVSPSCVPSVLLRLDLGE